MAESQDSLTDEQLDQRVDALVDEINRVSASIASAISDDGDADTDEAGSAVALADDDSPRDDDSIHGVETEPPAGLADEADDRDPLDADGRFEGDDDELDLGPAGADAPGDGAEASSLEDEVDAMLGDADADALLLEDDAGIAPLAGDEAERVLADDDELPPEPVESPEAETQTQTEPQTEPQTETETEVESEAESVPEPEAEPEAEADSDAEPAAASVEDLDAELSDLADELLEGDFDDVASVLQAGNPTELHDLSGVPKPSAVGADAASDDGAGEESEPVVDEAPSEAEPAGAPEPAVARSTAGSGSTDTGGVSESTGVPVERPAAAVAVATARPASNRVPALQRVSVFVYETAVRANKPLDGKPTYARDIVGWFAAVTLFNAVAVWAFWMLGRDPAPAPTSTDAVSIAVPEGADAPDDALETAAGSFSDPE